ncbi:hypothetical protein ACFRCW_29810 [Streptomyces sp. NPDC056653]|uniref:hypothetical protein n=1 Tax=Streptomyces sp. NPDC056653 TaxID=3345894 RepID=UPI0036BC08A1
MTGVIGDKNYFGRDFEHQLAEQGIRLLRRGPQWRAGTARRTAVQAIVRGAPVSQDALLLTAQERLADDGWTVLRVPFAEPGIICGEDVDDWLDDWGDGPSCSSTMSVRSATQRRTGAPGASWR